MRILVTFSLAVMAGLLYGQNYIGGYSQRVKGEVLQYHSPQPDADRSLLVRSEDSRNYIEWETDPVPDRSTSESITFLMLAGIDVNPADPHSWTVFLNGRAFFTISSPLDTLQKELQWAGPENALLSFQASQVDKYGDFMGYLSLKVPATLFATGNPVRIRVQGESAGSRTWFMVFMYEVRSKVNLVAEQAVTRDQKQVLRVDIAYYGKSGTGIIEIDGAACETMIVMGYNVFYQDIPVVQSPTPFHVRVTAGQEVLSDDDFLVEPVVPISIYLLHHSHNDIGYTHIQEEVERMQWKNLEDAMKVSLESKDFTQGARFKWNTEVLWAVDSYLEQASPADKEQFCQAVREGWIDLNAIYSNTLTGLCSSRELIELLEPGRKIAHQCGVELASAMVSDIPGWTWGLVPILAQSGVRYLSLGNNNGHRVGTMNAVWGDSPFWWVSQSAEDSVLCWIHGKGYSYFHTGLGYEQLKKVLTEEKIHDYANELATKKYPYDMVILRYNIGSDNGPVDTSLVRTVKAWNERYITPRLIISTVTESFSIFEKKYGSTLPSFAGDLTGYWEDGACSSALETAMNRKNASRLEQAEVLWSLIKPEGFPEDAFREAWKQVLLFNEHTWGSWNSISEPHSPFTLKQWEVKQAFALRGDSLSEKLLKDALSGRIGTTENAEAVEVFNTTSWERSDLVVLPPDFPFECFQLIDKNGNATPIQVLTSGEIVFLAEDVPAMGSKIFYADQKPLAGTTVPQLSKGSLENDFFIIRVDTATGAISSIYDRQLKKEWIDGDDLPGINTYYYVAGRDPSDPQPIGMVKFSQKESGPVVSSLLVAADAPGCHYLSREIRLIHGLKIIEMINTIDKTGVLEPEGLHMAFPFDVRDGVIRYDLGYAVCRAEYDQLPGACRNYITVENWADVSNQDHGITWITPDVPVTEMGEISTDATVYGWIEELKPSQILYSYVMNNYWETNYKASQEGKFTFRYILVPHEGFEPSQSERMAVQQRHPLIGIPVAAGTGQSRLFPFWDHPGVNIMHVEPGKNGKGMCVTLFNSSMKSTQVEPARLGSQVFRSDFNGNKYERLIEPIYLPAMGLRQVMVYF